MPTDPNELLAGFFNGTLDADQLEALERWVAEDPAHADALARYAIDQRAIEHMLRLDRMVDLSATPMDEPASGRNEPDESEWVVVDAPDDSSSMAFIIEQALADRRRHELEDEANRRLAAQQAEEARNRRFEQRLHSTSEPAQRIVVIPRPLVWLGLAAVVGLAIWIGHLATPSSHLDQEVAEKPREANAPPLAPVMQQPARFLARHGGASLSGAYTPAIGDPMPVGTYQFESGHIQIAMADGTILIVAGPAEFSIQSPSHVSVSTGRLSAHVPEGTEGFILDTPAGRVLDLGTEFGIDVVADAAFEVHVMEGQVVASLPNGGATRTLRRGEATRVDATDDEIAPVAIQTERFARNWDQAEHSPVVSDTVCYLYNMPASVASGDLENDALLFVLPEKQGVTILAFRVLCDFMSPGRYSRLPNAVGAVQAGITVDSYLLHYDRVDVPGEMAFVEGTIHFDRPIIGVIASHSNLNESDAFFAVDETAYPLPDDPGRGLESGMQRDGLEQDVIEISPDRMTLTVRLGTSNAIDQLRVLVETATD